MYDDQNVGGNPCQKGTRTWLLEKIVDWANAGEGQTIFWLNGLAGMGKSAIAQTIAHHFADSGQLGASFFFKASLGRSKADLFFPTIASALVRSITPLERYVCDSLEEECGPLGEIKIETKEICTQFNTLVFKPLQQLSNNNNSIVWTRVLVIDALDECESIDDTNKICQLLSKLHQFNKFRFRILLTSRDERPIGPRIRESEAEGVTHSSSLLDVHTLEESKKDIRAYLETCMTQIRNDREIHENQWPSSDDLERLYTLATTPSPLFIYVATVYRSFITEAFEPPQDQLKRWLANNHENSQLRKTYGPIMDRVLYFRDKNSAQPRRIPKSSLTQLQQILGAVVLLFTPLASSALARLLDLPLSIVDNWVTNLHAVLYVEPQQCDTITVLHRSFRDFLLRDAKSGRFDF